MLRNAAEGTKEAGGGEVVMEIYGPGRSPEGGAGRIDVFIHNPGRVREDKFPDIFKPFVSSRSSHHLGLGLTIAAMLAQQLKPKQKQKQMLAQQRKLKQRQMPAQRLKRRLRQKQREIARRLTLYM